MIKDKNIIIDECLGHSVPNILFFLLLTEIC